MNADELVALSNAYGIVAATETARELGVLGQLSQTPQTASALSETLGLEPRATCRLLEALEAIGVLEADARGRFGVSHGLPVSEALACWQQLGERLTSGQVSLASEAAPGADAIYPLVVQAMAEALEETAEAVAGVLGGHGPEVIDVGAGAATFSLPLARRDPGCRVTLVDRPAVLAVARARIEAAGLQARFELVEADLASHGFGTAGHDLALLGNVCHLFGEADNRKLLARLFAALAPGGELAIIDSMPEDYGSRSDARLHALSLALRTAAGDVHPFTAYAAWLRETGFRRIERVRLGGGAHTSVVRARKPVR